MSSKWRALQHRHKYTYSAVTFPKSYTDSLHQLPSHVLKLKFYNELEQIVSLTSIYSQVNRSKNIGLAFGELLGSCDDEGLVAEAARFYLEILFFENSLQLHRTLVSCLARARKFENLISGCFRRLCEEYGGVDGKGKRFSVSRVALSMMSTPKLGYLVDVVEECAVLVAWDVVLGLNSVVLETCDSSRPSPIVMEQCQEALSCSYYLLQRFPSKFSDLDGSLSGFVRSDSSVLEMLVTVILSVLKSSAFSRDCFVAAGVSFCAALQICLSPQNLGVFIMEGIFHRATSNSFHKHKSDSENPAFGVPYKGDLYSEITNFSELSRLCLIRGILTAVSRTVLNTETVVSSNDLNGFVVHGKGGNSTETILFDGILPELCNHCENPTDSHFNFHALTVLQICLQQIKTSMSANLVNLSGKYDPIPEDMGTRILKIIWNNLEDPLSQTVKQVILIFDLFLDIQSNLHWGEGTDKIKSFLRKIAFDLLCLGPRCKGRYAPLTSLAKRLGAIAILDMCPGLLTQTVQAYVDDDVCCAVTSFLKCFLQNLRDECWRSDGIEEGYAIFRGHCLPPFLHGLASGFIKLRSNLSTYAVPVLLEVDVDSIFPMLAFISVGQSCEESGLIHTGISFTPITLTVEEKLAILVSLLKVSRLLALIEGDIDYCDDSLLPGEEGTHEREISNYNAIVCIKGIKHRVPVEWFIIALSHRDESLRVDAAELLFLNPKTSSLPSHLELSLMREAVPLNMRCCSTGFQMKWTSMFRKFFARVKTALERQVKQGIWQPLMQSNSNGGHLYKITDKTAKARSEDLFHFMRWLSCFLFYSCYPSAPYERKIMAMDLFLIMIDIWSITPVSNGNGSYLSPEECLYLYNRGITLPSSTLLLVGSIVDSWDKLRENSFRILLHFPTPLPGISSQDTVQKVITWAKQLVESPRVRESDAGALTLRLIFRKYVLELKWIIRASSAFSIGSKSEVVNENENCQTNSSKFPVIEYINGLIDWLHAVVEEGEKDLYEACTTSFVHGVLLTLRYTFEELDWNSDIVLSCIPNMRSALEKLLELVLRITSLALGVVSADAWFSEDIDEMVGDEAFLLLGDSGSTQQVVMVGCWLAMKEVSFLLGTIVRKIPLPTDTSIDTSKSVNASHDASEVMISQVMLDVKQLETIGSHFLEVLLKMKHNGAIDKTRAGFTALCNRLLCSNDPRLCKLTDAWMEQLMEKTVSKGQVVDDLLRRSAGIPAAFSALFLSEPEGTPKKLLPRALRWLIDVANRSLLDLSEANSMTDNSCRILPTKLNEDAASLTQHEMNGSENTSKTRDEGVVPTVHAFNVLRAAFNDANLSTDTSGFSAEALIISIRSFSSPYWEIRNSACLAYTALVRRIIGFLNVQKRESARRALTGLEFFHRYPSLHLFLLNELKVATESLGDGSSGQSVSNLANVVHPSLYPILILLSRLKPSTITSEAGDPLDPFLFAPFIRRCSTQSNLKIRVLASRALAGLISNEKLTTVLLNISSELPYAENAPFASNTIQGTLLQLCSLLDTNCRNLADFSKKDQILGELIEVLSNRAWIGNPRLCCCPILNASFLKVLNHMLSIVKSRRSSKTFIAIRSLLLKLSKECLHNEASSGFLFYDPTTAEMRKQAVVSYFSCVFQVSKEVTEVVQMPLKFSRLAPELSMITKKTEMENEFVGFVQTLIHSLNDQSYEVRLATLKWLFLFLKSTEYGNDGDNQTSSEVKPVHQWAKIGLHDTLMKLLTAEKHHKCMYYILKIFFVWNKLQSEMIETKSCSKPAYIGQMDYDSVNFFWDTLVSLYKVTRHAKTQEAIICCLGICMKCFACFFSDSISSAWVNNHAASDQNEKSSHFHKLIAYYVNVIKKNSGAAEPVNMRIAAAESMVASGLLQEAEFIGSLVSDEPNQPINTYAHALLDIWFTCFKLLEDEDMELRQQLAMDLQKLMALSKSRGNPKPEVALVQVEKVIELSFEYLSSIFGHWIEYFDYLLNWVLNVANSVFVSTGDLVRRVFDKEIDNHHEENILISQICCYQLEKLPILLASTDKSTDKDVLSHVKEWRTRFCHQLTSFASDHIMNFSDADWIGGVGNHKDSFLPVYANLLGIYVLSKCIFTVEPARGGTHLLDEIVDVGGKISPFLRNPLISNLYLSVAKLHENVTDQNDHSILKIVKSDESSSIWDGFDPYFLIR